jgi:hypothetical protein
MEIINSYLWPFALSVIVETAVALLLGYRNRDFLVVVFFINLMTNPATNFLFRAGCSCHLFSGSIPSMTGLEVAVVVVEWRMLNYVFSGRSKSMFLLSMLMNMASFIAGLFVLPYMLRLGR